MRKGLIIIFAALATTLCSVAARADTLDDIKAAKKLRVAVMQDYPPFGFAGPDMQYMGIDIDVANELARRLGVKVELTPVTGANRIPYLQTKKVDLIIACLGKNAERAKVIDFSAPYAAEYEGIFGTSELKVSKPADLAGHSISVSRGATEDLQLTNLAPAGADIRRFEDNNGTLSAFTSGQVDMVATGNTAIMTLMKKNPARKAVLKFKMFDEPAYVGVNKGEARLMQTVNDIIAKLRADGTLNTLSLKWLEAPLSPDLHD